MQYCYVQNNAIMDGPRSLPESDAHRSNLCHSTAEELISYGWLPATINKIPYNNLTHVLGPPDIVISPTSVVITDTTVALDQSIIDLNIADKKFSYAQI